jgi:hypothetical protein
VRGFFFFFKNYTTWILFRILLDLIIEITKTALEVVIMCGRL